MRARKIFEKFSEDSDPIKDMGIGIFRKQTFKDGKELAKFLYTNLKSIVEHYGYTYTDTILTYYDIHKFIKFDIEKSIKQYIADFVIDYKIGWDNPNKYSGYLSYFIDYAENNNNMKAKKIFEKFTEDSDPIHDMGIGTRNKILKDLKDFKISESDVKITNDNEIYWVGLNWKKPGEFQSLQLKYLSPEKRKFTKNIIELSKQRVSPANTTTSKLLEEYIQEALDDGITEVDIKFLINEFADRLLPKSIIILTKLTRDEETKDYEEMINIYAFIGYTEKVPITISGKQYYEDKLEAESMIKIDKYNSGDLESVGMLKLRAKIQYGGDGNVYMVHVPKFMMDEDRYETIPEEHREFIEKHKQRI